MPTCLSDFPSLLFIVIAKYTDTGNYLRRNLNGILVSEGVNDNLGIYTFSSTLLPDITLPSRIYLPIFVIISRVPLHRPTVMFKFLNNMTGTPTFKIILWLGKPEKFIVFKNFGVRISSGLLTDVVSAIGESQLLISSTIKFLEVSMALSWKIMYHAYCIKGHRT